ncbi:hypothetical protein ACIA49_36410 [Kribbella sp. NPDC051587]|uniref:hypothetical protein n=1 Tax=Kribbella sp. NPDC051587 TaxID=3364119 RepID=UPI00378AC5FD
MPKKPGGGNENGGGNGATGGSGGSSGGGSGASGGSHDEVSVYSTGLRLSSRSFDNLSHSFKSAAAHGMDLTKYRPLVDGSTDESWTNFEPGYVNGGTTYANAITLMSTAVGQLAESLVQFAAFCEQVEQNNLSIGQHAFEVKEQS